jgi:hypothetical protein
MVTRWQHPHSVLALVTCHCCSAGHHQHPRCNSQPCWLWVTSFSYRRRLAWNAATCLHGPTPSLGSQATPGRTAVYGGLIYSGSFVWRGAKLREASSKMHTWVDSGKNRAGHWPDVLRQPQHCQRTTAGQQTLYSCVGHLIIMNVLCKLQTFKPNNMNQLTVTPMNEQNHWTQTRSHRKT